MWYLYRWSNAQSIAHLVSDHCQTTQISLPMFDIHKKSTHFLWSVWSFRLIGPIKNHRFSKQLVENGLKSLSNTECQIESHNFCIFWVNVFVILNTLISDFPLLFDQSNNFNSYFYALDVPLLRVLFTFSFCYFRS